MIRAPSFSASRAMIGTGPFPSAGRPAWTDASPSLFPPGTSSARSPGGSGKAAERSSPSFPFPVFFSSPLHVLNPQAAGSVTGARLGRRCRLSSLTTAQAINSAPCVRRLPACETDILVGFSARALSPRGYSLRPWRVEFTLCPATLPLPGKAADLGLRPGVALCRLCIILSRAKSTVPLP